MSLHLFPLDDHIVLFRAADRRIFILNPSAGWIWRAISDHHRIEDVAGLLADHYKLPIEKTRADVQASLDQWASLGLDPMGCDTDDPLQDLSPSLTTTKWKEIPGDRQPFFKRHFSYGSAAFTLSDYSGNFAPHLESLFASIQKVDKQDSAQCIDILPDGDGYLVACNGKVLERTDQENIVVGRVVQTMIEIGYKDVSWMAFVHAASGMFKNYGVIFPGVSGSGKSTLMVALVEAGWTYLCDDTVPLDTLGRAAAVPTSFCLKSGSWEVLASRCPELANLKIHQRYGREVKYLSIDPDKTGFSEPLPMHALIFPTYSPNMPQSFQSIEPVEGLKRLIQAQSWISPFPAITEALIRWIAKIPIYTLNYVSLDWAAAQLKRLILRSDQNQLSD